MSADDGSPICVIGDEALLSQPSVRARLDAADAIAQPVSSFASPERAAALVHTAVETDALVTIVLLPRDCSGADALVTTLISQGIDDAFVLDGEAGTRTLDAALREARHLVALAARVARTGGLIGRSRPMRRVRKLVAMSLRLPTVPLLILGETGTGKGKVARAVHAADEQRARHPMHTVDCGSLTDGLFGSELFGHVRGAFTGAISNRRGAFETAERGTLLLDEVGEMSPPLQSFLLTALQDKVYRPVGSDRTLPVQCRVIAATNRDLSGDIEAGRFRRDLYYRLNGFCLEIPPLRERRADILELLRHFVVSARPDRQDVVVDENVEHTLQRYDFPGNVRELESIARYAAVRMSDETRLRLAHLPLNAMREEPAAHSEQDPIATMVLDGMQMRDIEAEIARRAMRAALKIWAQREPQASRTQLVDSVARALGVSARTVYNKMNGHAAE